MSHAQDNPVRCARPDCPSWHPGSKWGSIRAHGEGWYHAKDGTAYCPTHVPEWVKRWRSR